MTVIPVQCKELKVGNEAMKMYGYKHTFGVNLYTKPDTIRT